MSICAKHIDSLILIKLHLSTDNLIANEINVLMNAIKCISDCITFSEPLSKQSNYVLIRLFNKLVNTQNYKYHTSNKLEHLLDIKLKNLLYNVINIVSDDLDQSNFCYCEQIVNSVKELTEIYEKLLLIYNELLLGHDLLDKQKSAYNKILTIYNYNNNLN